MSRWFVLSVLLALFTGGIALLFETRRLAEVAGKFEREAWQERQSAEAARLQLAELEARQQLPARQEPEPQQPAPAIDLDGYTRLQLQLHDANERVAALTQLLNERNAELARRAEAAELAAARSMQPIPEGVRQCLEGLHECLRAEGFYNQRFLRASSLDDEGLHGVEVLDAADDGLAVAFVHAARMTAELDRDAGRLVLRFFDGHRAADGARAALPEDGLPMVFGDIDGRLFERRLPFLVRGQGAYPQDRVEPERPATDVDPGTRRQWLRRLELVLGKALTDKRWRATRLRGMQDGWFLAVELLGTNDKGLLLASANCRRAAIEVDDASGVVSLLLQDGVLRQEGVESTITGEGYRMLLPGLTPSQATDAMFGMVVRK